LAKTGSTHGGVRRHRQPGLLDHSGERVDVYRGNRCIETALLANDRPRLVNHYLGVLADARQMLATGRTNLHFAAAIHRPLFAATAHRGTPWL